MFTPEVIMTLAAFGVVTTLVLIVATLLGSREGRAVESRVGDVAGPNRAQGRGAAMYGNQNAALPRVGAAMMPKDETKLSKLKKRMMQAGLYRRHSTALFMGIKFVLLVTPMLVGLALAAFGMLTVLEGIVFGALVGLLGNLIPAFWLSHLKSERQKSIRRAMPDALDVIVVCMEGGLSLPAAFDRVATELREAHPLLASENGDSASRDSARPLYGRSPA